MTPYIDGELVATDHEAVEHHLRLCPPCAARVSTERVVAALCRERRGDLRSRAPDALLARCARTAERPHAVRVRWAEIWSRPVVPLAAAATILLAVVGYMTTPSTRLMAAELAADHVKCLLMNAALGTRHTEAQVRSAMREGFDWDVQLPEHPEHGGLELIGSRPCLYQHGKVAHIMYRHNDGLASVYMLPGIRQPAGALRALGHEAVVWSSGDRTFVVVEKAERAEVERVAAIVRSALK